MARLLESFNLDLVERLFDRLNENPFFVKDSKLRYVAANPAMARLCGLKDPALVKGKTAGDIFLPASAAQYESLDRQVLSAGTPLRDRLELICARNAPHQWLLFSQYPVRAPDGKVVGIAATSKLLPAARRQRLIYQRVAMALERIRSNFDSPLNAEAVARSVDVSKSQLERDFVRVLGYTMQTFLHSCRMEQARIDLQGNAKIAEIAQDCGYSDHSAFTRRFRLATGMSPREFRIQARQDTPLLPTSRHWAVAEERSYLKV